MSQTYEVTMKLEQRQVLLDVVEASGTEDGTKGARRQARAAAALDFPVELTDPKAVIEVRLTHENVEAIVEICDRACRSKKVQSIAGIVEVPPMLNVKFFRQIEDVVVRLEALLSPATVPGELPPGIRDVEKLKLKQRAG